MSKFFLLVIDISIMIVISLNAVLAQPSEQQFTLKDAIQFALKKNPRVQEAEAGIKRSQGEKLQKRWLEDPTVDIELEEIPTGKSLTSAEDQRFVIGQSFPFPTKIYTQNALYSKLANRAEYNLSAVKLEAITAVKIVYYDALALKSQVQLRENILTLAKDFLGKAQLRYQSGEATNLEFLRAQVEATQAEQNYAMTRVQYENAKNQLKFEMGFDSANEIALADSFQFAPVELRKDRFLSEETVVKHPLYLGIQQELEAARFQKRLAQQSYLPDISIKGFKQKVYSNSRFYGFFVGFSFPLWFYSNQRGQIQKAEGELQQIEAASIRQKLILKTEITNLYNLAATRQSVISAFKTSIVPAAEEGFRVAQLSYQEGEIGYVEFLEAERAFIETEFKYLDALLEYHLTLTKLEQAAGMSGAE